MAPQSTPTFVANKFYQLEELEDKDDCSTEVFLKDDGSVIVGNSDGPIPVESSGEWELDGKDFKMTLRRVYDGGKKPSRFTDVGEFQYEVVRSYEGEIGHMGQEFAVNGGVIHSIHSELGDEKVGYFNIIDTTDAKAGRWWLNEVSETLRQNYQYPIQLQFFQKCDLT